MLRIHLTTGVCVTENLYISNIAPAKNPNTKGADLYAQANKHVEIQNDSRNATQQKHTSAPAIVFLFDRSKYQEAFLVNVVAIMLLIAALF